MIEEHSKMTSSYYFPSCSLSVTDNTILIVLKQLGISRPRIKGEKSECYSMPKLENVLNYKAKLILSGI